MSALPSVIVLVARGWQVGREETVEKSRKLKLLGCADAKTRVARLN